MNRYYNNRLNTRYNLFNQLVLLDHLILYAVNYVTLVLLNCTTLCLKEEGTF